MVSKINNLLPTSVSSNNEHFFTKSVIVALVLTTLAGGLIIYIVRSLQDRVEDAQELYEQGDKAFIKKQYDEAIKKFTLALGYRCSDQILRGSILSGRACANMAINNQPKALEDFTNALECHEQNMKSLEIDVQGSRSRDVENKFSKTKQSYGNMRALILFERASVYAKLDNLKAALQDCTEALKCSTNDELRKRIHLRKKEIQDLENQPKAVEFDNNALAERLAQRAEASAKLGDLDEAVKDYTEALAWNPSDNKFCAEILLQRSYLFFSLKKYNSAIEDCTKGLNYNPSDRILRATLFSLRGTVYLQQKKFLLAIDDMSKAHECNHDDVNIRARILFLRGSAYVKLGQVVDATLDFIAAGEMGPTNKDLKDQVLTALRAAKQEIKTQNEQQ